MIKYINLISSFLTISLSFGSTLDGSDGRDKVVSILDNQNELKIKIRPFPDSVEDKIRINYIRRPKRPKWTYVVYADRPYYNATAADHQDFDLHNSEYNNLVIKILMMAGVTIGNQAIAQAAAAEDNKSIQQEKL